MELAKILNWGKYYIKFYPDKGILEVVGSITVKDFVLLRKTIKHSKKLKKRIEELRVV